MGDEEGTFCNPEAAANIEDIRHLLYVMLYIFCPFAVASSCSLSFQTGSIYSGCYGAAWSRI
jgi:hypothetical protein